MKREIKLAKKQLLDLNKQLDVELDKHDTPQFNGVVVQGLIWQIEKLSRTLLPKCKQTKTEGFAPWERDRGLLELNNRLIERNLVYREPRKYGRLPKNVVRL